MRTDQRTREMLKEKKKMVTVSRWMKTKTKKVKR
jgi:hypothetical protein